MSTTVQSSTDARSLHVDIPEEKLADLRRRIAAVRWPSKELVTDRSQGSSWSAVEYQSSTGSPLEWGAGVLSPERAAPACKRFWTPLAARGCQDLPKPRARVRFLPGASEK